jgi:hypothetical protein
MEFWDYRPKVEVIGDCCELRVSSCGWGIEHATRNP